MITRRSIALVLVGLAMVILWGLGASWVSAKFQALELEIEALRTQAMVQRLEAQERTLTSPLAPTLLAPSSPTAQVTVVPSPTASAVTSDTAKTLQHLQTQLNTLQQQLTTLQQSTAQSMPTTSSSSTKEYVLYLGAGETTQLNWTTLPATTITIDPSQYRHVKAIYFEAGMAIVSGEVFAMLYDSTTSTPYVASQLMHNTSTGTWKTSSALQLPNAAHQYVVQIKSSNGERAQLLGARVRIVVE